MSDARSALSSQLLVAVDIGGTFTDIVAIRGDGATFTEKILSTPPDFAEGVVQGLAHVLDKARVVYRDISGIHHASTVATNAILEERGSTPALVTTKGFRDVLELGSGRRPTLYDLRWVKPFPLAPRRMRFEVNHRITSRGDVDPPIDETDLDQVADRILASNVSSVAVCLINSYVRPDEERRLTEALRKRCPSVLFTASVDLHDELGEFERTSTAVVNAYIQPLVAQYLDDLERKLVKVGTQAPLYMMQSAGGLLRFAHAKEHPVQLIESGPAAGVIATRSLVRRIGLADVISFDMGGTTAKASLIENAEAFETADFEVGGGINANRGYSTGGGYYIRVPSLDIAEVGAGGGSVLWVDPAGAPHVGPRSAGATPGPACYGLGGIEPTLSDACVVLGYFNPRAIAGGAQSIHPDLALRSVDDFARPLGLTSKEAAYGAVKIAIANMTALVRAVTTQRGRDPRKYALVAFGGSGPAYAAELAMALQVPRVIVPPAPGLWSAVGLATADPQLDLSAHNVGGAITTGSLNQILEELEARAFEALRSDGHASKDILIDRALEMRYRGQKGTLRIPVPHVPLDSSGLESVLDAFDASHLKTYGHTKHRDATEIVNVRIRARARLAQIDPSSISPMLVSSNHPGVDKEARSTYFGPRFGERLTPILTRVDLRQQSLRGPVIIEEMDATTVIPPWASAELDAAENIVITVDI